MKLSPSPKARRRVLPIAAAAVAATILLPAGAFAAGMALSQNGGAARLGGTDQTSQIRNEIKNSGAKNVILLIGDGMGDSEITIARNYQYGAAGRLPGLDAPPLTGQYTTYSLEKDGDEKGKPDYVPDSAATGSGWATGTKTYDGAISVDIDEKPQATLTEIAKANGLRTGDVSTAEIQDATPAVQVAHVDSRSCYGPDSASCGDNALINGGLGSISEQLLNTRPDVTLGGGSASFTQTAKAGQYQGQTLFNQATQRGYQVVQDAAGLNGVKTADQTKPVLGLFTPGNFPTRFSPTPATVGGADLAPVDCVPNPARLSSDLSLAKLTDKAISLLDTNKNGKGFFLQVEGASIDKQDHAANPCGQIGETLDLDEAVQSAMAFAKKDGNTLVIVTADHAHSSQIVDNTPPTSLSAAVRTLEGGVMKLSYGTAALGGSQQHTGSQVRVAAYGPGAANVVGLTDQTDTFFTMANTLRLDRNTANLSKGASVVSSDFRPDQGEKITITGNRFAGDRQVTLTTSTGELVGTFDVIDGKVTIPFTAPTTSGPLTLTLTGVQTGKVVTAKVTVR
ncbi:alkaline phosphatase [Clavibacter michiganensis]|uniref:alkaline phosphatase n=1 Tax=Clavibacter michiganensis TaxID=28447 RepID=UPI0026DD2F6C|nr:alkaline phosphatase [Clavibacter michiganensis]MDO4039312.1 alkaline phosphatase [Clavibacter michiganensis]MDO4063949.1 alkaline phosphatase [Clavibacter michiganensis]MDO4110192.1 alkaline phosphatase [Clavibacter michiganensis]MDO4113370.1 alkaline phosphatase [Clavibacter michiganensis]MDO4116706.1 alkaline phosphatase [Clavibacter michiganensis]